MTNMNVMEFKLIFYFKFKKKNASSGKNINPTKCFKIFG